MSDLYVPGLDLCTGLVVDAGDRPVWEWYKKGHNGDGTLVCLECYQGADWPDGPRVVPLIPRGRVGGVRQAHFAHPAGMGPPSGQHNAESAWHWQTKQRMARWASGAGAVARIEAWTADGRRRSDVAVTLAGGARLAIEVQYGQITDTEVLARREDYARAGIAVVWVWRPETGIPHVLYQVGESGWVLDLAADRLGLACGAAHMNGPGGDAGTSRVLSPHWPPCPGDDVEIRWMPLADGRLTDDGFLPSAQTLARLDEEATQAVGRAQAAREAAAIASRPRTRLPQRHGDSGGHESSATAKRTPRVHLAQRIDALPPWTDPAEWMYWCVHCDYLSGAELLSAAISHAIPRPDKILTSFDLAPESGCD